VLRIAFFTLLSPTNYSNIASTLVLNRDETLFPSEKRLTTGEGQKEGGEKKGKEKKEEH
jgi:hypothetical protein